MKRLLCRGDGVNDGHEPSFSKGFKTTVMSTMHRVAPNAIIRNACTTTRVLKKKVHVSWRSRTFVSGARPFVVQDVLETMVMFSMHS